MSNERPVLKDLALLDLSGAWWNVCELDVDSALALCQHAHAVQGAQWQGIAYSTRGAVDIRRVSAAGVDSSNGREIDLSTVYEMRLWRCDCAGLPGGLLAHELRWVNGSSGGVEVHLFSSAAEERKQCWYRPNEYLLHGQKIDGPTMTSQEVFTEDTYGNVVFADELMTGKWA